MEKSSNKATFTESLDRLREIVATIESKNPDVDELILLAEEAVELISFCRTKLTSTEEKVSSMLDKLSPELTSQSETQIQSDLEKDNIPL